MYIEMGPRNENVTTVVGQAPRHLLTVVPVTAAVTAGKLAKIDGLVQDCSNSSGLAKELLQSCTKP